MLHELPSSISPTELQLITNGPVADKGRELNDFGFGSDTILFTGIFLGFAYLALREIQKDIDKKAEEFEDLRKRINKLYISDKNTLNENLRQEESHLHGNRRDQVAGIALSTFITGWSLKQQLDAVLSGTSPDDFIWKIAAGGTIFGVVSFYNYLWTQREITLFDRAKKDLQHPADL